MKAQGFLGHPWFPLLRAAEMESFGRQLPILVVRPNNIYGPRQFPEKWGHQKPGEGRFSPGRTHLERLEQSDH